MFCRNLRFSKIANLTNLVSEVVRKGLLVFVELECAQAIEQLIEVRNISDTSAYKCSFLSLFPPENLCESNILF